MKKHQTTAPIVDGEANDDVLTKDEAEIKVKKEPLSLEELLAKKKAEMQAQTKVQKESFCHWTKLINILFFSLFF